MVMLPSFVSKITNVIKVLKSHHRSNLNLWLAQAVTFAFMLCWQMISTYLLTTYTFHQPPEETLFQIFSPLSSSSLFLKNRTLFSTSPPNCWFLLPRILLMNLAISHLSDADYNLLIPCCWRRVMRLFFGPGVRHGMWGYIRVGEERDGSLMVTGGRLL